MYALLKSLPRSSLATIQRNIVPLLQLDVVGVSSHSNAFVNGPSDISTTSVAT